MRAFIRHEYGGPETLKLSDINPPELGDDEVLVNIKANSVNPADWHRMRATPYFIRLVYGGLFKPNRKNKLLGADFAGVVDKVGKHVSTYKIGDEVFGEASMGSFSEFNAVKLNMLAHKPHSLSWEESACLGIAGITALQGIRDHGNIKEGETVLINGASGGVGHYAVQIAKIFGAKVTAICSTKNVGMVKSIGADEVIDYKLTDIHNHQGNFDLIVDVHGNLNYSDYKRMGKRGVMIGFVGMGHMIAVMLRKLFGRTKIISFTAEANHDDLKWLAEHCAKGDLKTIIDKTYPFEQLPEAIAYIEKMRTSGKVAVCH